MESHSQLDALDWDELMEMKKWSKLVFSMEEPAVLATQMAFAQRGNLLIPGAYRQSVNQKKRIHLLGWM